MTPERLPLSFYLIVIQISSMSGFGDLPKDQQEIINMLLFTRPWDGDIRLQNIPFPSTFTRKDPDFYIQVTLICSTGHKFLKKGWI